ncbi:MAG: Fic family protein [candidate division WOR-3 bacterium]|nr:MAG: Fic family protein [candidate division WOR-3 bacterium]
MTERELKKLPIPIDYSELILYLSKAHYSLGKLDSFLRFLPNPRLFIAPLLVKEATLSSRIDGIKSSIADVYLYEAGQKTANEDVKEIVNYRKAFEHAQEIVKRRTITINLIRKIHSLLTDGVRWHDKERGKFREVQTRPVLPKTPVAHMTSMPPATERVMEYMENLEKYVKHPTQDHLIQAALIHSQFECIHPFIAGNGRVGRMMVPLYLYAKKMISYPALYISEFFKKNRNNYYTFLNRASDEDNYEVWIKFFLDGVCWQCEKTQKIIADMLALYNKIMDKLSSSKSPYASALLDFIFYRPIFTSKDVIKSLNLNKVTASRLTKMFLRLHVLKESARKRNKVYTFKELFEVIEQ